MTVSALGSLTVGNTAHIGALPFVSANVTNITSSISVGDANGLAITAGTSVTGNTAQNTSYITLRTFSGTGGTANMSVTQFSATGSIAFSLSYKV